MVVSLGRFRCRLATLDPSIVDPYSSSLPDGQTRRLELGVCVGHARVSYGCVHRHITYRDLARCLLSNTRGVRTEGDYLMAVCEDVEGGLA